mgnify:CR=1 FL=1
MKWLRPGDPLLPPTLDETREALEAIDRVARHREELHRARGGKPFESAGKTLDELREERDQELP